MFTVLIKEDTFEIPTMHFLNSRGFLPSKEYPVVGTIGQKLLIADSASGEMVELFPRNCIYVR